jgi:nucleoside-diphosphate-sugar epimerase
VKSEFDWHHLVAGVGYTGRRLLAALPATTALGVSRTPGDDGVHDILHADFDQPVATLPSAACVIYTIPPSRDADPDPRLANFLAALAHKPRRIVYFSTSGVYGDTGGTTVDEDAAPNPQTARARRRLAAESVLAEWCDAAGVELSILRVPGIYGPGRLGLERLQDGKTLLRELDSGPGNRIHVDDLVNCALAAADPERPAGIYNVGDGDVRSSTWFSRTVAELAGLPPPGTVSLDEARSEWSEQRLSFALESRRLDLRRMYDRLRLAPNYPDATKGIRASLRAGNE